MPDDVYKKARVAAAERNQSMSALIRKLLTDLNAETEFERTRRGIREALERIHKRQRETGIYFNAEDRLTRDELYDRETLRRHERSAVRD